MTQCPGAQGGTQGPRSLRPPAGLHLRSTCALQLCELRVSQSHWPACHSQNPPCSFQPWDWFQAFVLARDVCPGPIGPHPSSRSLPAYASSTRAVCVPAPLPLPVLSPLRVCSGWCPWPGAEAGRARPRCRSSSPTWHGEGHLAAEPHALPECPGICPCSRTGWAAREKSPPLRPRLAGWPGPPVHFLRARGPCGQPAVTARAGAWP